ncbi:MAG: hypothetical protein EU541_01540 [Promethearchaeota archaeon]|nr:MAG: hypothetical protein EU541_01540 [Candidatus Lokiarchaeota archaeon]
MFDFNCSSGLGLGFFSVFGLVFVSGFGLALGSVFGSVFGFGLVVALGLAFGFGLAFDSLDESDSALISKVTI